ncbi:MAG TPA: hypothetical protein VHY09_16265 [Candidatus Methylacidiphilales bacterium]|jgi:hypothetical protein|nr:hypothetical protein [Candidatus Methylacidiphilales bacterium]
MRSLVVFLLFASACSALSHTISEMYDSTDPEGYGPVKGGPVDHAHTPLLLKLTPEKEAPSPRVMADILVYNNTDQTIDPFWKSDVFFTFKFEVADASGTPAPLTNLFAEISKQRYEGGSTTVPLRPGEYQHFYQNLSKLYVLTPGKYYKVRVSMFVTPETKGSGLERLTSDSAYLHIP